MPVASVVLAYLLGSVPFALLIARRWGAPDLRHVGSGNLGATNVLRASGVTDFAKYRAGDTAEEDLQLDFWVEPA